jgi:hypothetical protein
LVNDVDEENEEDGDGDDGEGKLSMLKLFLMMVELLLLDDSWTPKRRSPPTPRVKDVHVLQLCPILPQCEHFLLPICLLSYENEKELKDKERA